MQKSCSECSNYHVYEYHEDTRVHIFQTKYWLSAYILILGIQAAIWFLMTEKRLHSTSLNTDGRCPTAPTYTIYCHYYLSTYLYIIHYICMHHVEWLGLWPGELWTVVVCPPSHWEELSYWLKSVSGIHSTPGLHYLSISQACTP